MAEEQITISTKELLDSVGTKGKNAINAVYKILCYKTNSKGTAFLIKRGVIITNEHVVRDCDSNEILGFSNLNEKIEFKQVIKDSKRDLAILIPKNKLKGGLRLVEKTNIKPGIMVCAWGFPLMYNGPAPLLSTGFLAGFAEKENVPRLIINGAFNNGNSGGPLLKSNDDKVLGVVVAKHLPLITPTIKSLIEGLAQNKSGLVFSGTDKEGKKVQFAESQIVAEILTYYHKMHQVVIGEAIESSEVIIFLKENSLYK